MKANDVQTLEAMIRTLKKIYVINMKAKNYKEAHRTLGDLEIVRSELKKIITLNDLDKDAEINAEFNAEKNAAKRN